MVYIPFIYFSLFAFFLYKRNQNKINVPVYIALIFSISGLFSILMDIFGLRNVDTYNYNISIEATLTYCICITFGLIPIALYTRKKMELCPIQQNNINLLKNVSWFASIFTIFYFVMSLPDLLRVLTGNMGEMRTYLYRGFRVLLWYEKLSPSIRYPITLSKFLIGEPWIMIFLGFYLRLIQKLPSKYFNMLFLASLIGPIDGIMGIDRSKVTYWLISLIGCFIFFRPYMGTLEKKKYLKYGFYIISLFTVYLSIMTLSRFGDNNTGNGLGGSTGSLIYYFGQSFINFCYFFDTYEPSIFNPSVIAPFTTEYLLGTGYGVGTHFQEYLKGVSGIEFGVFYTYLGTIYIALGRVFVFLYSIIVCLVAMIILRNNGRTYLSLHKSYAYMMFATIPMLGLFIHHYMYPEATFAVVSFYIITSMVSYSNKKKQIL